MYKVITAIGNENINKELIKTNKYSVIFPDIVYQEALLEIIENNEIDKLILLDTLPGEFSKFELIDKIININSNLDIIVINEFEDKKFSKYLLVNGISKQINSYEIDIHRLCMVIDEEYVEVNSKKMYEQKDDNVNTKKIIKEFDKKIISVNGTNSSGKTTFAVNVALCLANSNKKVLLIDLDTITASVDKFLGIDLINKNILTNLDDEKKCVLNYIVDCIQKDIFDYDMFSKSVIEYKNKNLHVITGNTSMYICQNVLCENLYNQLLNKAIQVYDYIIIDTNSSMFLDSTKWALEKSDIIYYLFEGTYKDVINMKKTFLMYEKVWNICMNKISPILSKYSKYSLSIQTIENIAEINIQDKIEYNEKYIEALNNSIPIIEQSVLEKNKYEKILGINETINFFKKMKNSIKGVF